MIHAHENIARDRRLRYWEQLAKTNLELAFWMEQLALRQWQESYEYHCGYALLNQANAARTGSVPHPIPSRQKRPRRPKPEPVNMVEVRKSEQSEANDRMLRSARARVIRGRIDVRESGSSFDDIVRAMEDAYD